MKKTAGNRMRIMVVPFLSFVLLSGLGTINLRAQDPCIVPTVTGNNQNNWNVDYSSEGEIEPGSCVDITILKGCPPYQWSSNNGLSTRSR